MCFRTKSNHVKSGDAGRIISSRFERNPDRATRRLETKDSRIVRLRAKAHFQDHQGMQPFRADTLFDATGPGRRERLPCKAPPRLFFVEPDQRLGHLFAVRSLGNQQTFVPRPDHDATDIKGQGEHRTGRARLVRLGTKDPTSRRGDTFKNFETRKRGHQRSLHWRVFEENGLTPGKPTNQRPGSARRAPTQGDASRQAKTIDPSRDDDLRLVLPDGLSVRRRRHDHGWSPRALVAAIELASINASGLRRTLTPNLIKAIEEQREPIRYEQLLLLADGLGCDPVDLLAEGEF